MADHGLALEQDRGLAGRGAGELLAELDLERRVAAGTRAAGVGRDGGSIWAGRAREW